MNRVGFLRITTVISIVTFLLIASVPMCWGAPSAYPGISIIRDIYDTKDISTISAAGGEKILIKGSGFVTDAKVFFAPVLKRYNISSTGTVSNVVYMPVVGNSAATWAIQSGTTASAVNVIDSNSMQVTTPAGSLFSEGVMVVNPDGGASDIYYDLTYDFAKPDYPLNVVAKRLRDGSGSRDLAIKISWDSVPDASGYEIYRVIDGSYYYIAATNMTSYTYTDILKNTDYRFAIKAVVNCGISYSSGVTSLITTTSAIGTYESQFNPDIEADVVRNGDQAVLDLKDITYYPRYLRMDLTQGVLKGCREAVVDMPVSIITSNNPHQIKIDANGFQIKFSPSVFNSAQVSKYSAYKAGVQFRITQVKSVSYGLNSGKGLSPILLLEASLKCEGKSIPIRKLDGYINFGITYKSGNTAGQSAAPPWLYIYDSFDETWDKITNYGMNVGNKWSGMVDTTGYYKIISQ